MFERDASSYYEVLEVGTNASYDEIDEAYQRIASYLSPDSLALYSMATEEDVARMRTVVDQAYRTLSDPGRRAAYDNVLSESPDSAVPEYPSSVMVPEAAGGSSITLGHVQESASQIASSTQSSAAPDVAHNSTSAPSDPIVPESGASASTSSKLEQSSRAAGPSGGLRRLVPKMEIPAVDPEGEVGGSLLKSLRESADASLKEVAEMTKVSKRYLRALEDNDFDTLPAQVYVRGFATEYARVLGLDAVSFTKSYMRLYNRYRGEGG